MILRPNANHLGLNSNFGILDQGDSKDLITASVLPNCTEIRKDKQFPSSDVLQDIISYSINTTNELEPVISLRYPHFKPLTTSILADRRALCSEEKGNECSGLR